MSKDKLIEIFNKTLELDYMRYDGDVNHIIYSDLINLYGYKYDDITNLLMIKYNYNNKKSLLIITKTPMKLENNFIGYNERLFDIIKNIEETFTTLNYLQIKEDKGGYIYFICIKIIGKEFDD